MPFTEILRPRKFLFGLLCIVFLFCIQKAGWSHLLRFSSSEVQVKDTQIDWTIKVHLEDFDRKFANVEEGLVRDYVNQRLSLLRGGAECTLEKFSLEKDVPQQVVTLP